MDIVACRRNLDLRLKARRAADRSLWKQARTDADAIVEHIAGTYRPRRIIQWGSILEPDRFRAYSDIDLAIEGHFDAETWFTLLGEAARMTHFPLDIVDLEHVLPEFAQIIMLKGKVVYERAARTA